MDLHDSNPTEQAILAVLTGTPIAEVASWARSSPEILAEAAARYRAAGRTALTPRPEPSGWHQLNIEFADYQTAERAFLTYLLPPLRQATDTGVVGSWWFVRKYPCWRLRVIPSPQSAADELSQQVGEVLDSAVSWRVVRRWWPSLYEPEATAFGGPDGTDIAHGLFHGDSVGVLGYIHHAGTDGSGLLDAKATSLLVISLFLRAAGQEWSEQGDVWARVEAARPLPDDVSVERVTAMTGTMRRLLAIDAASALATGGPLTPVAEWVTEMERGGRALGHAGREGRLNLGTRGVLARHILFHWNRMGFTTRQQAIWARAARETTLGN
ncbi:thiopeptide-type bacteriocin biosynthesis protein [Streptomyces sp. NBC_01481]|uniref:thiopeptide-type bacteriocin biosynthesis protein n=1 Tax=Streptomyces sp. NBC_01481 TaxID=2975869 RepID=UPI0022553334|nr:thiopeptide-type bacteriocin biosynthesis protein [Streptomyces sp. NBC_01481]MCX4582471.1 thiopeptide-type bacteriocin biosynthesis protein [Streptomyces sp. NBC_01481]